MPSLNDINFPGEIVEIEPVDNSTPILWVHSAGFPDGFTFETAYRQLAEAILEEQPINRGKWQQLDVSQSPLHATRELRNVSFIYLVPSDIQGLRDDTRPDIPWADVHFDERVGREPLNPAPSYKIWPHHKGNADRHMEQAPREIDERDWAYLAALIDGDGSITWCKDTSPVIQVAQKDHEYVDALYEKYGFGSVTLRTRVNPVQQTPIAKVWTIGGRALLTYVLEHINPYLILKRAKGEDMLKQLNEKDWSRRALPPRLTLESAKFSHTYPERFWPKGEGHPRQGIRYQYGDLEDVVNRLVANPHTRQAILPIWFPEDTADIGQRVPCSLFYHFMSDGDGVLSVWYSMRSCDLVRHFRNDVYMAGRLLQWVCDEVNYRTDHAPLNANRRVMPGSLNMTISNLHVMEGDVATLKS